MKIMFCGAATDVTGSCHLISTDDHKILLDCGQFQGGAAADALNAKDFPFNPTEIEAVLLSHAHIDHCGRLPLLVKRGFKGIIYGTDATIDLLDIMLKDSAHIQEQDTETQNRKNKRAGRALEEPLYTTADVLKVMELTRPVHYDTLVEINDQMKFVFNDAGHILGSAITEVWVEEGEKCRKIVFSGDLGMDDRPILKDPKRIKKADCLIMESTYGDRLHEDNPISIDKLADIVARTIARGGNVVIPSFAVGRTQELVFELNKLIDGQGEYAEALKDVPVYVDSPMSVKSTEVFRDNAQDYDEEMKLYILSGDHPLDFKNLHYSLTSKDSQRINTDTTPKVIISSSGMCDAGRIRHHLKHNLWNPKCSVVFVGYQAEGTVGRRLLDGAKEIKLFGETISVAAEMYNLEGFSGHADRNGLFSWLSGFINKPDNIFLVHGEYEAKNAFAKYVKEHKNWDCTVVNGYDEYTLADGISVSPTAEKDFADPKDIDDVRTRLYKLHDGLEKVMYNAAGTMQGELTESRMTDLKNTIASLEKDMMKLGAVITREDR